MDAVAGLKSGLPGRYSTVPPSARWPESRVIISKSMATQHTEVDPAAADRCCPKTNACFATASTNSRIAKSVRCVREMDEHAQDRRRAHRQAVRPRRHGHRDSREPTAAPARASSTRCWRSKSCRASIRRSACSSTCRTRSSINALLRWGSEDIKRRYLPRLAADTIGAYALSEAGSGSDAFALTHARDAKRGDDVRDHRPQALDHQRQRSRPLHRVRQRQSRSRLPRHHRVRRRARLRRVHGRQEGRQARHPREQHVRAALRGLPRAARERARRGRQGLQGRRSKR